MATRFWVGGTGNWDAITTTHWAATTNGAGGASVPTTTDDVTFDASSGGGTVTMTAGTTVLSITAGAYTNGTLNTNGQTIACTGNGFSISGSVTRTITLGASQITTNVWTATTTTALTFNANTSVIIQSGANTFAGGGLTYNEVQRTQSGANIGFGRMAGAAFAGANTFATLKFLNTGAYTGIILSANQTVTSVFQAIGLNANTQRMFVFSSVRGTARTITCNGTVTLTNVDFEDMTGAGSASWAGGTSVGDCGGNSGITFTPAVSRFWVHSATAAINWMGGGRWAATTGGAVAQTDPLPQDTVVFDANSFPTSGKTVTVNVAGLRMGASVDFTGVLNSPTLAYGTNSGGAYGSMTFVSGMSITASGGSHSVCIYARSAANLTSGTLTFPSFTSNGLGTATVTHTDNLLITAAYSIYNNTMDFNGKNITCTIFTSTDTAGSNTQTVLMGSGTLNLTGTGTVFNITSSGGLTVTAQTSTIKITDTSNTAITFAGGSRTFNNIWFNRGASTASNTISGSNTWGDFKDDGTVAHSLLITDATTQTVKTFTMTGTVGNVITINGTSTGVHFLKKSTAGTISCDWLDIQHSVASPMKTWYAGANSTDHQANATAGRGWIFTVPPTGSQSTFIPFSAR